jgi:hypothetical protein
MYLPFRHFFLKKEIEVLKEIFGDFGGRQVIVLFVVLFLNTK